MHHLDLFGIEPLTGEACGLMMRVLCDVTSKGKQILESVLCTASSYSPRGTPAGRTIHVGSIAAPQFFGPIAVFCLGGHHTAHVLANGVVAGIGKEDPPELVEQWRLLHTGDIERRFTYAGTAGDRNIHQMSGRVV
ncbi:MAG: hypothetical protein U1D30_06840 [Planctomycetota bacterium]